MLTILDSSCCRQLMLLCCWWLIILLGCHWLVVLLSGRPQWLSWHGNAMVKYYLVRITEKTNKPGDPCRLVIVLSMVPSNGQVLANKIQYVKIKKKNIPLTKDTSFNVSWAFSLTSHGTHLSCHCTLFLHCHLSLLRRQLSQAVCGGSSSSSWECTRVL